MIKKIVGRFIVFVGCGIGLSAFGAHSAHAQRMISDYEASRLTLASLTAAPVVRHHHHHATVRHVASHSSSRATRFARNGARHSGRSMVRTVAYHPHGRSSVKHLVRKASYSARKPAARHVSRRGRHT